MNESFASNSINFIGKHCRIVCLDVISKDTTMYPTSSSTTAINTAHAAVMGAVSQQKLTPGESRAKLINQ